MRRQEKDAELDRRIVALRKKNQALLRRYQEIQEDRRQAEQGGMAVTTPALLQPDGLTVTISQVPGVSLTLGDRACGEEVEGQTVSGEDSCLCSPLPLTVPGCTHQLLSSCNLATAVPTKEPQLKSPLSPVEASSYPFLSHSSAPMWQSTLLNLKPQG
ncbi:hypothetical protein P7K49_017660 [Saguinus oedipus]|uniref:Uncharacterized protein n=1 Tax=Saguinus oedipus TaxID=9490 RepID=A0ABQ9V355_SAGOE|nr:hypothetical protein P7K49_017660 [Saguinus oedipus]